MVVAEDRHRIGEEQERGTFLEGVVEFFAAAGQIGEVAAVEADGGFGAGAQGGPQAIHRGFATAEDGDAFAGDVHRQEVHEGGGDVIFDQEGQRLDAAA